MSDELDEDDITSAILGECTQACLCHPAIWLAKHSNHCQPVISVVVIAPLFLYNGCIASVPVSMIPASTVRQQLSHRKYEHKTQLKMDIPYEGGIEYL